MSRTMYDSVTPSRIPLRAQMVAGYIEGPYAWKATDWARFPHAVHVQIATVAKSPAGVVIDVEAGDSTPDLAVGWVVARRAAGVDPTVYCSLSAWPTVRAAFKAHGVAEPHYWIAHYNDIAQIPAGAVACQYSDHLQPGCDTSIVADYWPGVDPAPQPSPGDNDLTTQEHEWLEQVWNAVFGPVPIGGGEGVAPPNNLDIVRRTVSPYAKGYPPANPPAAVAVGSTQPQDADPAGGTPQ